jgi:ABC-type transport system substrate-binding protein
MALSGYDADRDGVCDHPTCDGVLALFSADPLSARRAAVVSSSLEAIGVELDVRELDFGTIIAQAGTPSEQVPIVLGIGWFGEFPNGLTYVKPPYYGATITEEFNYNFSLVGARPDQLAAWGYAVASVPGLDAEIDACTSMTEGQPACWAEVDRRLTEDVVPAVPLSFYSAVRVVSERVLSYSLDQSTLIPALERIALSDAA